MKKILFSFCLLFLFNCEEAKKSLVKITAKSIKVDSTLSPDNSIENIIAPFRDKMETSINTVITYTKKDLVRTDGELESSLGNLMADLSFERANPIFNKKTNKNIDFAMFNYGGIRAGIPAGEVTNKHAFELMPFENSLVVVELKPEKIKELVTYLIKNNKAHPLSKQIKLSVKNENYSLSINGDSFDNSRNYFVLTSDYLQSGGDKMDFFKNPVTLHKLDYKVRNAIIDYFKSKDTLISNLNERFKKQ
ncbi:UDP-sugar hydrolase [Tenacibaculum sp. SZ-18]|uniref:5'-nucleotidase C-terminal domain-containing protein n=1 Tax=Tenacibaculum sp. SZ-18 TaxID=754423 RepID=UPI000C2D69B6|nr:5'-nucleotidase [Tenacibaculum sp. SZ-18]AUC14731.1 UDP-sugar hydrolase [Tenacibaculum sp. SZ-18]